RHDLARSTGVAVIVSSSIKIPNKWRSLITLFLPPSSQLSLHFPARPMASTNPTARPPKAPPMTSMPSTPGPDVPGGYPRNSTVFASNQWDKNAKSKSKPGLFAAAKNYLPPAVASYLPKSGATPTPNGLAPPPLNRDGSTGAVSDNFSTRAYAGSGSSRDVGTPLATPLPSDFPSPPTSPPHDTASRALSHNPYFPPAPGAGATTVESPVEKEPVVEKKVERKEVIPVPTGQSATAATPAPTASAAPADTDKLSPVSAASTTSNTNSTFSGTAPSSVSTAPSSPASPTSAGGAKKPQFVLDPLAPEPASPKSSKFANTLARLGSRRRVDTVAGAGASAPPSSFNAGSGHARARSEGGTTEFGANAANGGKGVAPKRSGSLLRTLRGEATVLAGRMRRDPGRVERGRRMMDGAN
ncbi:hypothetical protein B0H16DRAFT_344136, partial [Mycena metata]